MVNFRAAVRNDLGPLLDLIEAGFSYQKEQVNPEIGREHRILFDYLYSRSGWQPEQVCLLPGRRERTALGGSGFFSESIFDGCRFRSGPSRQLSVIRINGAVDMPVLA